MKPVDYLTRCKWCLHNQAEDRHWHCLHPEREGKDKNNSDEICTEADYARCEFMREDSNG